MSAEMPVTAERRSCRSALSPPRRTARLSPFTATEAAIKDDPSANRRRNARAGAVVAAFPVDANTTDWIDSTGMLTGSAPWGVMVTLPDARAETPGEPFSP